MANHTINLHANHSLLEAIYYKNFWNFLTSWRAESHSQKSDSLSFKKIKLKLNTLKNVGVFQI